MDVTNHDIYLRHCHGEGALFGLYCTEFAVENQARPMECRMNARDM
jgi:hypothetical protein